jgi:hypothetical protein
VEGSRDGNLSLRGGPVGVPGKGLVYPGFVCRGLWRRAPLSIGAPLGRRGGLRSPGTLRDSWGALETEHLSLWALCERKLEGGLLNWGL